MRKLFAAGVIAIVLAASTAFALDRANQPVKGTEGPDIRLTGRHHSAQPVAGPDIR